MEKGKKNGKRKRLRPLALILFGLALFSFSSPSVSTPADFPAKPIKIIVAFSPGGASDFTARTVGNKVSALCGQPVVVEFKPGGGGVIGTLSAKTASPDGYTILQTPTPFLLAPLVQKGIPYHPMKDFTPINVSVTAPCLIVVKKDAPWMTLEELIADAKKNPGKLTCGIPAYGALNHLAAELLKIHTGVDFTIVPMDGLSAAMMGLLGGHLSFCSTELGGANKFLKEGSLRVLAVMEKTRHKALPDVPTMVEKGFPGVTIQGTIQGFVVRSETPRGIVERLGELFKEALKDQKVIEMLERQSFSVENLGPQEAERFLNEGLQIYSEVIKRAGIVSK